MTDQKKPQGSKSKWDSPLALWVTSALMAAAFVGITIYALAGAGLS